MGAPEKNFPVPQAVTDYFADKKLKPAFSWLDVWGEEHAYSFTVAKAVETELLSAFRGAILDSLKAGEGFASWRERIEPELKRLGWFEPRTVVDPTGQWKDKKVHFGAPRRLETIFWSNVRSARAAGQWERIQRTKDGLPFLLYVRTTSAEPREEHLRWVGLVLPVDDPFWEEHFPPSAWGCKCSVRQITRREADRLLAQDGYSSDASDFMATRPFINRRTGEVSEVPVGVDPGWGTNPGLARARNLTQILQGRLDEAGPEIARQKLGEWMNSPAPEILAGIDRGLSMPVAVAEKLAADLGAASPIVAAVHDPQAGIGFPELRAMQTMIDTGEARGTGEKQRAIVARLGDAVRHVVIDLVDGFLRVTGARR